MAGPRATTAAERVCVPCISLEAPLRALLFTPSQIVGENPKPVSGWPVAEPSASCPPWRGRLGSLVLRERGEVVGGRPSAASPSCDFFCGGCPFQQVFVFPGEWLLQLHRRGCVPAVLCQRAGTKGDRVPFPAIASRRVPQKSGPSSADIAPRPGAPLLRL